MIKVNYPVDPVKRKQLEAEYYEMFKNQESVFNTEKDDFPDLFDTITYKEIIVGRIKKLVEIYGKFVKLPAQRSGDIKTKFEKIFSYKQKKISQFFEEHNDIFNLKACHYCNMDSVHVYSSLRGSFDKYGKPKKIKGITKNHFTLDHYIPKASCFLFARSFYNFVPSCYSCNAKLKKEKFFSNVKDLHTCCPTYEEYDSTGNLEFSLVQKSAVQIFDYSKADERTKFLKNFEIEIESTNTNNRIVSVLHLKQRYSLYKDKAVYLAYLKEKYSDQSLEEIARILSQGRNMTVTANDLRNDIFNDPLYENESFSKLHRDIKKQVGIKTRR